jgi:transcriptional regulator with XRE-family HTH domain
MNAMVAKRKECVRFGRIVSRLRVERGFSQEGFAAATGLHRTYMGGIERGERNPTLTTILRIAEGLKIEPTELFRQWPADKPPGRKS